MNLKEETVSERAKKEMFVHLAELYEECESLLASRDGVAVYNGLQKLRSLIGQIDNAAQRYRRYA